MNEALASKAGSPLRKDRFFTAFFVWRPETRSMNEEYRRCCGMNIHKDTVVVCVLPPAGGDGQTVRKVYGTFRNDLIRMRVWLKQLKATEIAMESTGVYWRGCRVLQTGNGSAEACQNRVAGQPGKPIRSSSHGAY